MLAFFVPILERVLIGDHIAVKILEAERSEGQPEVLLGVDAPGYPKLHGRELWLPSEGRLKFSNRIRLVVGEIRRTRVRLAVKAPRSVDVDRETVRTVYTCLEVGGLITPRKPRGQDGDRRTFWRGTERQVAVHALVDLIDKGLLVTEAGKLIWHRRGTTLPFTLQDGLEVATRRSA